MILKCRLSQAERQVVLDSRKERYQDETKGIQKGFELSTIIIESDISPEEINSFLSNSHHSEERQETSYRIKDGANVKLNSLAKQSNCSRVDVLRAILSVRKKYILKCAKEFDILENMTSSLIPLINPGLSNETGIKAAILYRVCPTEEIDSSSKVREAYTTCFGENIPESADTIFNAFIPFMDFCRAKLMGKNIDVKMEQKELLLLIFLHLDEIFMGYDDLKILFDNYFNLMYSFANLMPAPKYFNGSPDKNGKGTWILNKDYPSVYYDNLKDVSTPIYHREDMKAWLDSVMDKYKIKNMYQLKPPYPIDSYYGWNDDKLPQLKKFIEEASELISKRADKLCGKK